LAGLSLGPSRRLDAADPTERPFGGPMGGMFAQGNSLDYSLSVVPGQSNGGPAMVDNTENARLIVAKTEKDTWSVSQRFGVFTVGDSLSIPGVQTVPNDLYTLEVGGGYSHKLGDRRDFSLNMSVGSDSDRLFNSIHETVFRGTASYRMPSGAENAWMFFLSYSNNRHFLNNIPLPGVAYAFKCDDKHLDGIVGFPFLALRWKPTVDWTGQLSLFGPRNLTTEVSRRVTASLRAYGVFQWNSQEWMTINRGDNSNRLFFDRKKVGLGLRSPLPHGLLVDVSGGRQFDQHFFINDASSYKDVPTAGLPPAWYIDVRLGWRWG
jgi:hypothetical protein